MCDGCCCGSARKHPDVDHTAISGVLEAVAKVIRVDCLGACAYSNLVVVSPSTEARRDGARPAWVRQVNTVGRAELVAAWVLRGGPGASEPPVGLGPVASGPELRRAATARRAISNVDMS
ncbi:hypothetical protein GCM10023350_00240 [Nocardioides endophyticus]|uniref:(2Fe-2S) ferredoxin domain-containing protein n=1 Tax=Nocardioides endophyticus TaxID=1353775 RepID=A0ABP8Y6F2_9ACTN